MKQSLLAKALCGALVLFSSASCAKSKDSASQSLQIGEHLIVDGASALLSTHTNGRHIFVSGQLGDEDPINVIVDTGSGRNVIDTALAERLGFEKIGETEVLSGGVEPVAVDIVIVPMMRVDNLLIKNAEFITIGLGEMSLGQFHGVLGMGLFEEALLTFDSSQNQIKVAGAELSSSMPGVIPFESNGGGFNIKIDAAGQEVSMHLDTGAPTGFTFPFALSETLPLTDSLTEGAPARLVGGERSTWTGTLDGDIRLGDHVYEKPEIMFIDPSSPHGNIGNGVLGAFAMSIDQKNGLLALRPPEAPAVKETGASDAAPRRLGVQLRGVDGGALAISMVVPGSLADQAGFLVGDVLVTVNGAPAGDYNMNQLGALFRSAEPLRFEVDRDGVVHVIEIS